MKAIVNAKYGSPDVLELKDIEKPTPKDNEVLIKVYASSVNAGDWHLLRADPFLVRLMFGLFSPRTKILGADVAGRIEAIGKNIKQFKPGDEVYGDLSVHKMGGFSEYAIVKEDTLALKPTKISFEEAAAVPSAGVTALQGLRDHGHIQAGQKVLINGASGGVGSFAVQIAKSFGAEVTAVCSTRKVDIVQSMGADHIIDYQKEDFTQNGKQYDLILAANGYNRISDYSRSLNPQGRYVMAGGSMKQLYDVALKGSFMSKKGGKVFTNYINKPNQKDLIFLSELLESGKIKPVIDKVCTLAEVPEAIRYIEDGKAKGKVVIGIGKS
jgi:NADPH:quinone reductase-like Zn-dependent oxidoreductase